MMRPLKTCMSSFLSLIDSRLHFFDDLRCFCGRRSDTFLLLSYADVNARVKWTTARTVAGAGGEEVNRFWMDS
jgi:hypothetical protein